MGANSSGGSLYFDAGVNLNQLRADFAKGIQEARAFSRGVTREGRRVDQAFNQSSRGVNVMNTSLGNTKNLIGPLVGFAGGTGLLLLLSNQIKNAGKEAYQFSVDFEMAMKEVATISGAVRSNFKGISDEIVNMAANGPDDAIQLAQAYYQIVSAGYDGAKGLELLRVSSEAATAGITDTKTAADGITTVLNAWGKSFAEAESVADVMFKTVEKGKTTFPELASNIAQVAPVAASLKIPFEQIMAMVASITKQGTTSSMALTQVRSALVGLSKKLGGEIFQQGKTLQEVFEDVAKSSQYSIDELIKVTGRIEGANAILATTGEKLGEAKKDLDAMTGSAGAMKSAYGEMMEAAKNEWSVVHNRWNRELKSLGDSLTGASIGMARFFKELLQDRDADIVAPKVSGQLKDFQKELDGIEDLEKKREFIVDSVLKLRDARRELTKEEDRLQGIQPGTFQKGIEAFNAGIGLGDWAQSGRVNQKRLEIVEDDIKVNKQVERKLVEILNTLNSNPADGNGGNGGSEKIVKSLTEHIKDLEALQDNLGKGTIQQDVDLLLKISDKETTIENIQNEVREKLKEALEVDKISIPLKSLEIPIVKAAEGMKKIELETDKILDGSRTLTKEEKKRLEEQSKQLGTLEQQRGVLGDIKEGLTGASEIMGALSYAIGEVDADLGQALGKIADLTYNAATLAGQLANQNYIGAIATGIGMLGNIFSMFGQKSNPIEESLERINRTLERQSAILSEANNINYFGLLEKQLDALNQKLDVTQKKLPATLSLTEEGKKILDGYNFDPFNPDGREIITAEHSIDQILEYWSSGLIQVSDYYKDIFAEIMSTQGQINTLLNESYNRILGFGSDTVSDMIVSGVKSGLETSEDGLGDWTDNFGKLLEDSLTKHLMTVLNQQLLTNFMQEFTSRMQDGSLDGDVDVLRDEFIKAVEAAQVVWDEISPVLDEFVGGATQSPLTGAIKGIQEETASLIAGQFMAMRIDLKNISDNLNEMLDWSMRSFEVLESIDENTFNTVEQIKSLQTQVIEMNTYLKQAVA